MIKYARIINYFNKRTISPAYIFNRMRVMGAYCARNPYVAGYAPMVHIEPTNACNLKCEMCPRDQQERPVGLMDFGMYKALIDELRTLRAELIYLHLFGEPMLHPRIIEMITYAKKNGIDVAMSTNATMLDTRMAEELLGSGIDIFIISFDAADDPAYYERIRKNASYEQVFANIKNFLNIKGGRLPYTIIQTIRLKGSEHADKFLENVFPRMKNTTISNKPFDEWGGKVERINKLSTVDVRYNECARVCEKIWRTAMIHYDGTVVPCSRCFDHKFALGKFGPQSLKEIWNGAKMLELRKAHLNDRLQHDYCKSCYYVGLSFPEAAALTIFDATFFEKAIHAIQEIRERKFTLLKPGKTGPDL